MKDEAARLSRALWRVYHRPQRPLPWAFGGNLPWDEPDFSRRMLREHLDEAHAAASRQVHERQQQLDWLWHKLALHEQAHLLDVACGPGLYAVPLAQRGVMVTGIDFAPAALAYARELAAEARVDGRCTFIQQDMRQMTPPAAHFDAALLLYGQLAVMSRSEAQDVLHRIVAALKPGGRLCLELLDPARIDKRDSRWWYTDDTGLWGDAPYLHLGERFWDEVAQVSTERYHILHLETGQMDEILLCDQAYQPQEMTEMLKAAGFTAVVVYPAWGGLPLYDAAEWVVTVAVK